MPRPKNTLENRIEETPQYQLAREALPLPFDSIFRNFEYSGPAKALIDRFGEEGAFRLVDQARAGDVSPVIKDLIAGANLPELDREIEGSLSGIGIIPISAIYEMLLKPAMKKSPTLNKMFPLGFQYQEGITSPPSWGNVAAMSRGAIAGGRLLPKEATDPAKALFAGLYGGNK